MTRKGSLSKPEVRLGPIQPRRFVLGMLDGQMGETPDFSEPIPEAELAL